ncbi:UNVERIFIED_CONTAM: hypothetical protein Slati_1734000 [Sesamum latifolium]|uniref:Uncharacterized protein n=1 Tax=Sesamum latifolium TaxID=2727402 RepID=A0AAW2WXL8_9LAMI
MDTPEVAKRKNTWNLLRQLSDQSSRAWICVGDFNEILYDYEKEGMHPRAQWQMNEFRQCLTDCELQDMGFKGAPFTWCNNREEPFMVRARLDRACCTKNWADLFPLAAVNNVATSGSDHWMVWVDLEPEAVPRPRKQQLFRFKAAWTKEKSCTDVIRSSWNPCSTRNIQLDITPCIQECRLSLLDWNKHSFGNIVHQMKVVDKTIGALKQGPISAENKSELEEAKAQLEELSTREEILWRQRAKALWLEEGDKNSAYFHAKASERRQKKMI